MNIERAADILYKAENERRQVAMLSQDNPDMTIDDAYICLLYTSRCE